MLAGERGGGLAESVEGVTGELAEVVRGFRSPPGLLGKAQLAMVTDILGPTDWDRGPGDDAAVLPQRDGQALIAGEAMWPPFVERDPFGAGGAEAAAKVMDIPFLGRIPLDQSIREASDAGTPPVATGGPQSEAFAAIARKVLAALETAPAEKHSPVEEIADASR